MCTEHFLKECLSVHKTILWPNTTIFLQVVLGSSAKEGEANVVELEGLGYNDKKQRIPICVVKAGSSHVTNVDVSYLAATESQATM